MCLMLEETVRPAKAALVSSNSPVNNPRPALSKSQVFSERPLVIRLSPLQVARNTPLLMIMAVGFIGQFGLGMLQATFALYAAAILFPRAGVDATNLGVGLLLAVVGLGQFVTQTWLIRPLKERFGDARLVIMGNLLRAAALVIYAVVTSPWLAAVGSLFFAMGMGLTMPPLQTLATRTVDESLRGGVLGVFQSAVSLAIIFSTAIAGVIFSFGATLPSWIGAILSLAAILPALSVKRQASQGALAAQPSASAAD